MPNSTPRWPLTGLPLLCSHLSKAVRNPRRVPGAALRRLFPSHPRLGYRWLRLADGSITFREQGFVAASSPSILLARHNYETCYLRSFLSMVESNRSLEVGCGYGRLTPIIASLSRHHTAIDINMDALITGRRTYPKYNFCRTSAISLPFPGEVFDLVCTWTVLQHIPPDRIAMACAELQRCLAPGGRLLLCEETRHPNEEDPRLSTWHRYPETYERLFSRLTLQRSTYIDELDQIPGSQSPGRLMLFS